MLMPRTRYLRLGATRSLGQLCRRQRLQISDDVVLALVQIAFDRTRMRGWRVEIPERAWLEHADASRSSHRLRTCGITSACATPSTALVGRPINV